jgi:hypothetical protein
MSASRRSVLFVFLCVLVSTVGCSQVEERNSLARPVGVASSSVGGIVLRVNRREDLPNVFGRADLFGRTRDRGFIELRYMGVDDKGMPVFRRRDVEVFTNETTVTRSPGFSTFSASGSNNSFTATGSSFSPAMANVAALPADTIQFAVDTTKNNIVTVEQNGIEILEFNSSTIRYRSF